MSDNMRVNLYRGKIKNFISNPMSPAEPIRSAELFTSICRTSDCYEMIEHLCAQFTYCSTVPVDMSDLKANYKEVEVIGKKIGKFYASLPDDILYNDKYHHCLEPLNALLQSVVSGNNRWVLDIVCREILEKMPKNKQAKQALNIDLLPLLINHSDSGGAELVKGMMGNKNTYSRNIGYSENLGVNLYFAVMTQNLKLAYSLIELNKNYIPHMTRGVTMSHCLAAYRLAEQRKHDDFVKLLTPCVSLLSMLPSGTYTQNMQELDFKCGLLSRYIIAEDRSYLTEITQFSKEIYKLCRFMLFSGVSSVEVDRLLGPVLQIALDRHHYKALEIINKEILNKYKDKSDDKALVSKDWNMKCFELDIFYAAYYADGNGCKVLDELSKHKAFSFAKNSWSNFYFAVNTENVALTKRFLDLDVASNYDVVRIIRNALPKCDKVLAMFGSHAKRIYTQDLIKDLSSVQITHDQYLQLLENNTLEKLLECCYITSQCNAEKIKFLLNKRRLLNKKYGIKKNFGKARITSIVEAAEVGCVPLVHALSGFSDFSLKNTCDANFSLLIKNGELKTIQTLVEKFKFGSGSENDNSISYALGMGRHKIANFLLANTSPHDIIKTRDALVKHHANNLTAFNMVFSNPRATEMFAGLVLQLPNCCRAQYKLLHDKNASEALKLIFDDPLGVRGLSLWNVKKYDFAVALCKILNSWQDYNVKFSRHMGKIIAKSYNESRMCEDVCNLIFHFARPDHLQWKIKVGDNAKSCKLLKVADIDEQHAAAQVKHIHS